MKRTSFDVMTGVLHPADTARTVITMEVSPQTSSGWVAVGPDTDVVLWGYPPHHGKLKAADVLRRGIARPYALLGARARPPAGLELRARHALPPTRGHRSSARQRLRELLGAGLVLEFAAPSAPSIVDAVLQAARVEGEPGKVMAGSGGVILVWPGSHSGERMLIRMAPEGSAGDPAVTAAVLEALTAAGVAQAPRLLRQGVTCSYSWTAESLLPGQRPRRLTRGLALEAGRFLTQLPTATEPPTATERDLELIASALPERGAELRRLLVVMDRSDTPSAAVMRHGDFWRGNLLSARGRLSGVIDWDAAHPAALPGTDLLQLVATEVRARRRLSLGAMWERRPWRSEDYLAASKAYWTALQLRPSAAFLERVGVAWWAAEVAGTLARFPQRAKDDAWLTHNVDAVLSRL